jgi:hypothetical protein
VNAPLLYVSNTQPVPEMAGYSEHLIIILSKAITFSASEKREIELLKPYFLKILSLFNQRSKPSLLGFWHINFVCFK